MKMINGGIASWVGQLRLFWNWWVTELDAAIPERWRQQWQARERRLIWSGTGFVPVQAGAVPIAPEQLATDPVVRTWRTRDRGQIRLLVLLPSAQLLHKVIQLPAAAEPRLADVLAFELDRHTPFSAEDASFGYRVVRRDRAERRIDVELFVLPAARRDAMLKALADAGLSPQWLLPETALAEPERDLHLRQTLNLLPERVRPHRRARWRWPLLVLGAMALLLLALFQWQQHHRDQLQARLQPLQQQAEQARAVQVAADRLEQGWRFLSQRRQAQPARLLLLDELTRRLPDHTWVSRLELEGSDLQLQGESSQASELIGLLEASPWLQAVSFTSPVTVNPRSGKERFSLQAQVRLEVTP
ncbi:PilN domain-containing protein [Marinobacterium weihaiense]|uniref:PilN domain-containing protein n=1 Tax=Marinobacterium weihaiense TaxID=2851016 RepID=A0ABS6MD97_9GAMM|nr:PilN domain-containing protein [Marinobacterium weihaiense]MBV0934276.1 PilN domain-containing protein [Marinobacterium weihaiense]